MVRKIAAIVFGVIVSTYPSGSFAQVSNTGSEKVCSIHFWPAANMRAAVDSLVGGGLIDNLAGTGPLAEATETLRSSLDPKSQFDILRSLDFTSLIHTAKASFVLEPELSNPFSLKKKSPPLTTPETKCYIEIIMAGVSINSHAIYGVAMNSAIIMRIYSGKPYPDLAFLTGAGMKVDKAKAKIRHSSGELTGAMRLAFQTNLTKVVDYAASKRSIP